MDKGNIQKFAVWARKELIEQVKLRAYWYGVTEEGYGELGTTAVNGKTLTPAERDQRAALVREVKEKGCPQVMEEAAYTWFNRFIALRFLEVNGYLPSHVRVLSDPEGRFRPEILSAALEVELPGLDREYIEGCIRDNRTEELYRYLLLAQCNALHEALPVMFERVQNWTELLLPDHLLKEDGVLGRLVKDIPEENWTDQVQIIGWLYQYYNTEVKAETFALLKKNVKIIRERIPSATQLFTPDWIVRYMVENSLGRLWLEGHPDKALREGWRYYLDEAPQEPEVQVQMEALRRDYAKIRPQDIKVIDPCCGSGHILVYAFDVLIEIYRSQGVRERDAVAMILENNLYGLDIDPRAAQLAWFAVMMKARQYDRRIFVRKAKPQVYSPKGYPEGEEFGSLLTVEKLEPEPETISMYEDDNYNRWRFRRVLAGKYDVVVTNPPYMAVSNASPKVQGYIKKKYPDSKSDLFASFIERCGKFIGKGGYQGMITQHAWMFLSSYEKLRGKLRLTDTVNMVHLGARAFEEIVGEVVQTTSFVFRQSHIAGYKGTYCRLIEPTTQDGKEEMFLAGENRYTAQQDNFAKIPGAPVAYWLSNKLFALYENGITMDSVSHPKVGMQTSNNDKYLRLWFEINYSEFGGDSFNLKWVKYLKGGAYRKWYGNLEYVLFYNHSPNFILLQNNARVLEISFLNKEKCTWTDLTSGNCSFRYAPKDTFYDISGHCFFPNAQDQLWLLAYTNTKIFSMLKYIFNSTFHCQVGDVAKIVVPMLNDEHKENISVTARDCVRLSSFDWDSFETSWDFRRHPLV